MFENNFNWGGVFAIVILLGFCLFLIIILVKRVKKAREEERKEKKEIYADGLVVYFPERGASGEIIIQEWCCNDISKTDDYIVIDITKAVKIEKALLGIIRKVVPMESSDPNAVDEHEGNPT